MKNSLPICSSCNCRKSCLVSACTNDEADKIIANKSSRFYKKNQILYLEGEKPQGVFCISSGKVKIAKTNREGKEQIIRIAIEGDNLGYSSVITEKNYLDSAIVIDDAQICFIPKHDFLDLVYINQSVCKDLLKRLSVDLLEAEEVIKNMAFKPVRERIADAFLLLKKTYNHTDNTELLICISRGDLANLVGTAKETATRLLTEFKEDNIIVMEGRDIRIIDWNKLNKISQLYA
jgi:CRP/FNR family transcriptional regulator, polysaccharide utilization system transcription regulator